MSESEKVEAGPEMEAVMRAAVFRSTEHCYDIEQGVTSMDALERAWREGWKDCRDTLTDDEALHLTDDVEEDAWADSAARLAQPKVDEQEVREVVERCQGYLIRADDCGRLARDVLNLLSRLTGVK